MKKGRSGKKNLGLTRNQRRKQEYAAKAAAEATERRRSGAVGKHARDTKSVRLVGSAIHQRPCGNHACEPCRDMAAPKFPGRLFGLERIRTEEEAQARGLTWANGVVSA